MQSERGTPWHRAETLLAIAERHATGIDVKDLADLLPEGTGSHLLPSSPGRPSGWTEVNGRLFRSPEVAARHDPARAQRGARYLRVAGEMFGRTLSRVSGLIRTAGVTGSVAFGEPEAGDDLDFMVIARNGSVWPFLLYTFLMIRFRGLRQAHPEEPSTWCFNYVLDEATAEREFTRDQGFHFAREALSVQPVVGAPYYAGLLGRSPWMATEAPGYYRRWTGTVPAPAPAVPARPTPWAIRGLNWLLFPLMATYLQAVALRDNHRCRRAGTPERQFQVVSRPGQLEIRSTRFAQTAALFRPDPN